MYELYDGSYYLVLLGALICLIASARVNSTFRKYSKVRSMSGMTGAMAADRMLKAAGIYDVHIQHVAGNLTDHYDPRNKTLNLSDPVYGSASVAAIGVACHECGHAIQDQKQYLPLKIRAALVPAANFGSNLSWPIIVLGFFFNGNTGVLLMEIGILMFSLAVLFQLVTLPVEFNASNRAVHKMEELGMLGGEELTMSRKVLGAAAMTYVASAASAILQLLRLISLLGRRRD